MRLKAVCTLGEKGAGWEERGLERGGGGGAASEDGYSLQGIYFGL